MLACEKFAFSDGANACAMHRLLTRSCRDGVCGDRPGGRCSAPQEPRYDPSLLHRNNIRRLAPPDRFKKEEKEVRFTPNGHKRLDCASCPGLRPATLQAAYSEARRIYIIADN